MVERPEGSWLVEAAAQGTYSNGQAVTVVRRIAKHESCVGQGFENSVYRGTGQTNFLGYLADPEAGGKRPGVLIAHAKTEGGWHWRPLSATLGRLPLPIVLFPRAEAYKRIEAGRYRFVVAFTVPGLGMVLRYGGLLDAEATAPQSASSPGKDLGSGAL